MFGFFYFNWIEITFYFRFILFSRYCFAAYSTCLSWHRWLDLMWSWSILYNAHHITNMQPGVEMSKSQNSPNFVYYILYAGQYWSRLEKFQTDETFMPDIAGLGVGMPITKAINIGGLMLLRMVLWCTFLLATGLPLMYFLFLFLYFQRHFYLYICSYICINGVILLQMVIGAVFVFWPLLFLRWYCSILYSFFFL